MDKPNKTANTLYIEKSDMSSYFWKVSSCLPHTLFMVYRITVVLAQLDEKLSNGVSARPIYGPTLGVRQP